MRPDKTHITKPVGGGGTAVKKGKTKIAAISLRGLTAEDRQRIRVLAATAGMHSMNEWILAAVREKMAEVGKK